MQPGQLGAEFLTYVLWAVSAERRAINLGEISVSEQGRGKLKATTELQSFLLFVTVEPYAAVREPGEMLVLENAVRKGTTGKLFMLNDYKLVERSQYQMKGNSELTVDLKNVPIEMYEARNAVEIAQSRGADKYAPDTFREAQRALRLAEHALARKANHKDVLWPARQAAQFAEESRAVSVERQERIAAEESSALAAQQWAAAAEADRVVPASTELRARLLEQFNRILQTRDSPRGLVVTMADALFGPGSYDLRMDAREKLARFSGIVLAHSGLNIAVEGHTDSTGSDEYNQKASELRAQAVRNYLIRQGLSGDCITAAGFGKESPVADNTTAEGRQKNWRVELIVSGEPIGGKTGK
ncbi:OmpA/MotB domain protein (fragment) [Candidatus Sulfopaludibacter sp. SbA3]